MSEKGTPKEWGKQTVAELKEALSVRGLQVSGRKSELVDRLSVYEKEIKEDAEENETKEGENETEVKEECVEEMDDGSEKEIVDDIAIEKEEDTEGHETVMEETTDEKTIQDEVKQEETENEEQNEQHEVKVDIDQEEMEHEEQNENEGITETPKEETEKPKEKEEVETQSHADSLSVNLDQDIGNLGDLDESNVEIEESDKGADGFVIDRKGEDTEGITIETVGEVDDEEFGAAVANIDDAEVKPKEEKKEKEGEAKKEEKDPLKGLSPVPSIALPNWMVKKYGMAKRSSSLYIKPLSSKDILCAAMVEWASRAVYFCINHERDGKGTAVLNFMTEKECSEAKDVLQKTLAEDVKVVHPSRQMEKVYQEELKYKWEIPNLAQRTLIVEGAPEGTSEDQVCLLFPGAISVSKPEVTSMKHKWQGRDYVLPECIKNIFIVEFGYNKAADRAIADDKEYEIKDQKLKVKTMSVFQKEYKEILIKLEEEARKRRQIENEKKRKEKEKRSLEEVYSDKERIEMCRALKNTIQKRATMLKRMDVPWNERLMVKEKLSAQVLDIVRALDVDTDKRVKAGLKFPEAEHMMTKHTRQLHQRKLREQKVKETKQKKVNSSKDISREKPTSNTEKVKEEKKSGEGDSTIDNAEMQEKPTPKDESRLDDKKQSKPKGDAAKTDQSIRKKQRERKRKMSENAHRSKSPTDRSPAAEKNLVRNRGLTEKEKQEINIQLRGLEADKRGWWTIKLTKPNNNFKQADCEKLVNKYGRIEEIHLVNKNAYVRFSSRTAVVYAMRGLWNTAYKPEVPPVQQKYKAIKSDHNRSVDRSGSERLRSLDAGKANIPSLLTANTVPLANQLQKQAQQQMLLQQQLQQQQLKQQQEQLVMMQAAMQQQQLQAMSGEPGILGRIPQKSPLAMQSGMTNQMGKGQTSISNRESKREIPSLFGASGVPPLSDERRQDRERPQRARTPERRSRFDRKSPVRSMSMKNRDPSPSYHQDIKRSRRDDYEYGFKHTSQPQRQAGSSVASDRPAAGSGDTSAVANVLKGITQVLSSKMQELSRLGGTSGQKAMKEVIDSIGNIQGVMPGGGGSGISSATPSARDISNQSSGITGSQGYGAYGDNTGYSSSSTTAYSGSTGGSAYGNQSGTTPYGRSSVTAPTAPVYSNTSYPSYSNNTPANPSGNVYGTAPASTASQSYLSYSAPSQNTNIGNQNTNMGGYGSNTTSQYGSSYPQTGQHSYGSRY